MFYNIFLIILFLVIFFLATIGYGKFLSILLFKNINKINYGEYGLFGLVFVSFISTFIHFFYKIDTHVNFLIYLIGLFLLFNFSRNTKLFLKKNKILISLLFVISFGL